MNSNCTMAGEEVPKGKVRYEEEEGLIVDKGFCSKNKTRKSNLESTKVKTAQICLPNPMVKKVVSNKIKLARLPSAQEPHEKAASSKGVKRIRIDEVLNYFTESRGSKVQAKTGEVREVDQQGILSSRCEVEVRLKRISIAKVEDELAECREKPSIKEGCHG